MSKEISIFWFRRDLRLEDNTAIYNALNSGNLVLPIFIFDTNILNELDDNDARVTFIYSELSSINNKLKTFNSGILCLHGSPKKVWRELLKKYNISDVFFNKDYEPYARNRDEEIETFLLEKGIKVHKSKDDVIFEEGEILKGDGKPYTIYTPYKNRWLSKFAEQGLNVNTYDFTNKLVKLKSDFPSLSTLGFVETNIKVKEYDFKHLDDYGEKRDFPSKDVGSYLGPHLRFGTVSIRQIINNLKNKESVFLSELIWREFFKQILYHYPYVVTQNFKSKYNGIKWRNNKEEFDKWCKGETGYPMVDAGMRQLNKTGYMHNRVRMITAGFLCKHLLIDWRWGEVYFAKKLLDYELSSNNGNWQWAAGTGCDAAPYFRIFNPITQLKKFDKDFEYVKEWIPELDTFDYPHPIVDHKSARKRALEAYKDGIKN